MNAPSLPWVIILRRVAFELLKFNKYFQNVSKYTGLKIKLIYQTLIAIDLHTYPLIIAEIETDLCDVQVYFKYTKSTLKNDSKR